MPVCSRLALPFNVSNRAESAVECDFDLPEEFTLTTADTAKIVKVTLEPLETRQLNLNYRPTMVSSHEFFLPIAMNNIRTDIRPDSSKRKLAPLRYSFKSSTEVSTNFKVPVTRGKN